MSQAKPFAAIPLATLPDDLYLQLGPALARAYEQHGPIFRASYFGTEVVYLVGPEANRYVLVQNRDAFSHHIGWGQFFDVETMFGHGLLTMDGPVHDHHRRIMNPAFTVGYMSRYVALMQRIIGEHIGTWAARREIDVYDEARLITFEVAAQALAGLAPGPEVDRFRYLYLELLNLGGTVSTLDEYMQRADALRGELATLLTPKIAARRAHPTDDTLGLMAQARDEHGQPLSDEQIIAHTNILLVAGHETSTSLSAWLLYLLCQHPDYTERIRQEQSAVLPSAGEEVTLDHLKRLKVLENALSEAERLYPPVGTGPRGVVQDFEFGGYTVPAGTMVLYAIAASHLLPTCFADPATFDPDRFAPPREEHKRTPYALVGFGGGPRICIGINFAQIEIKALATQVLQRYDLALVPGQRLVQVYTGTGRPLEGIRLRVTPRADG